MATVIKKGSSAKTIKKKYLEHIQGSSRRDIRSFCGVITLKKHPVALQKEWRDEWK
ncbi:hypothetical protein [Cyclonatronum proteinivorum]|uniref:hypothetical protein n=1 Tax=Cyclonatronum proteinivorum TaxID=1457365 RepID=UPI0013E0E9BD|nr:hypothetical protein [Cyclonatronum proteinivorum]